MIMIRPSTLATCCIALLGAHATTAAAEPVPPATQLAQPHSGQVREVIVIIKTHFDIGYTHRVKEIVHHYRTDMIDQAMNIMDQSKNLPPEQQFAWTLPGWPMTKITEDWPGQTPERKQRIMQAFKDGRFVVHALPFSMHTETLELEDLARGLGCASRLASRKLADLLMHDIRRCVFEGQQGSIASCWLRRTEDC